MQKKMIEPRALEQLGLSNQESQLLADQINHYLHQLPNDEAWFQISKQLLTNKLPFDIHYFIFTFIFPNWPEDLDSAPVWSPTNDFIKTTNLIRSMAKLKIENFSQFHAWSVNHFEKFWEHALKVMHIQFQIPPKCICELTEGFEHPIWLCDAKFNIAESCFTAHDDDIAIYFQAEKSELKKMSYGELNKLSNQVANSLVKLGYKQGDAIAIIMPMNHLAVAIYLGIIKMGGIVVSIPDSFSSEEIAMRLRIAKAKLIFTQDKILRQNKEIPLYQRILKAHSPVAIVLSAKEPEVSQDLRTNDIPWEQFLVHEDSFKCVAVSPMTYLNILFSSGTTGDPKAIPWTHTTPIKTASDAYFHHNIQQGDILSWPTNLGWMMGPWLIFAAFINQAAIAIYDGLPKDRFFGEFIQNVKVSMLGVVPTLVGHWKQTGCMEGLDWSSIKAFSSTGECSNPEDMFYLMYLAGYKPIIEYCGGTEIGGGYVTGTVIEKNYPSLFSTPALGSHFLLIDEAGQFSIKGDVALVPPAIGLSTELLNADHHKIYYEGMQHLPDGRPLRRHGDVLRQLSNGYYTVLGRSDDSMNLGGIKVSSSEIERVIAGEEGVIETAAIGVPCQQLGPNQLVIYVATQKELQKEQIKINFQKKLNEHLNPLFKICDVLFVSELPKTASNKIMRRELRKHYQSISKTSKGAHHEN